MIIFFTVELCGIILINGLMVVGLGT